MKGTPFQGLIEGALLQLHTGFVGKVISINGNLATIQPLNMVKAVGGQPQKQPPIPNCPVVQNAKKFVRKSFTTSTAGDPSHSHTVTVWDVVDIQAGDTVYCVCADRDISDTRGGGYATPVQGHHELSFAVVVGII